jgi:hypothetical protein
MIFIVQSLLKSEHLNSIGVIQVYGIHCSSLLKSEHGRSEFWELSEE